MKASFWYGLLLITALFLLSSCANYTFNGMKINDFKDFTRKEKIELGAGIASSFLVHWLAHIAFYEINGIEWHQVWTMEVLEGYWTMDDSLRSWCGRIGTVTQLGIGATLKYGPWSEKFKKSKWVTGFHLGNAIESIGYLLTTREGIQAVNYSGGNGDLEWAGYGLFSTLLLMEREEKPKRRGNGS